MQLNQFIFRPPKSSYSQVNITLLPHTELLHIQSRTTTACFACCSSPQYRHIPVLVVKSPLRTNCPKYIMFFHSTSEDIVLPKQSYQSYEYLNPIVSELNVNLILVEYPGYGIYNHHSPSADAITEDARDVYEYFLMKRKLSQNDIVVMGRCLGSGPACYLASKYSPAGLITISAYTSIKKVVSGIVGSVLAELVKDRFDNLSIIEAVKCPILVIHGRRDSFISCEHSQMLISKAKGRIKQFHFSELMTHNEFDLKNDLLIPLSSFFDKIDFSQQNQYRDSQFNLNQLFRRQISNTRSIQENC